MMVFATIGATGLYLLFIWLISAAGGGWLAERKGYGERVGLTFGLLLSAVGLLLMLLLPGRPGSQWKEEGWLPRRGRAVPLAEGPPAAASQPSPPPESPGGGPPPA